MKSLIMTIARKVVPHSCRLTIYQFMVLPKIIAASIRQRLTLCRVRRKVRCGEAVNVLFLVSEVSKWKCQSLYDLMAKDTAYSPVVGIMMQDAEYHSGADATQIDFGLRRAEAFFAAHGCKTVRVYDVAKLKYTALSNYSPDIVFYQQPWCLSVLEIVPETVARFALTCYIPYYVPNYINDDLSYGRFFHKIIYWYFVLNNEEALRGQSLRRCFNYAGSLVPVGHPMLDDFYLKPIEKEEAKKSCVIYSPHFTFSHPNNQVQVHYSTFLNNGEWLLQYAKVHPELNWIFKPHPVLKTALRRTKVWSDVKIENYYSEWSKIGRVCEDGDYMQLFREATAMITDCGSFLSEFGVTKKPIIHLINTENDLEMPGLYDAYYKVHDLGELAETLYEVLEQGNDYKKDIRIKAIEKANLSGQYAAKNIMDFFAKEFKTNRRYV